MIQHHLEEKGIIVGTGAACSGRKKKRSHVLEAMGLPVDVVESAVRFSLGRGNTVRDIDKVLEHLPGIVAGLKPGAGR